MGRSLTMTRHTEEIDLPDVSGVGRVQAGGIRCVHIDVEYSGDGVLRGEAFEEEVYIGVSVGKARSCSENKMLFCAGPAVGRRPVREALTGLPASETGPAACKLGLTFSASSENNLGRKLTWAGNGGLPDGRDKYLS
jgi:hypothetical protein